eukprot:4416111-Alexandrium_andersonii.AAC.1
MKVLFGSAVAKRCVAAALNLGSPKVRDPAVWYVSKVIGRWVKGLIGDPQLADLAAPPWAVLHRK